MWYVASQIVFCMLLAALLGFLIGWLLRKRWYADRLADVEAAWKNAQGLEMQKAKKEAEEQAAGFISLQGELAMKGENLKKLSVRLGELESLLPQGKESEGKWRAMEKEQATALREKDGVISGLEKKLGELESLPALLKERDDKLAGLEPGLKNRLPKRRRKSPP
jgi:hypothetical protein